MQIDKKGMESYIRKSQELKVVLQEKDTQMIENGTTLPLAQVSDRK